MNFYEEKKASWVIFLVLTVGWIALIIWNSLHTAAQSSQVSGEVVQLLQNILTALRIPGTWQDFVVRKAAHFLEYAVLGVLLSLSVLPPLRRILSGVRVLIPPVLGILVACADEYVQTFVPGRSGNWTDVCIDLSGVLTGLLFYGLVVLLRRSGKRGYR